MRGWCDWPARVAGVLALGIGAVACTSPPPAPEPSPTAEEARADGGASVVLVEADQSLGLGTVLTTDGFILTVGPHLADAGDFLTVTLGSGDVHEARLEGADPRTGLAVIKVDGAPGLTPAVFADSDRVRLAEEVRALPGPLPVDDEVRPGLVLGYRSSGAISVLETDADAIVGGAGGPLVNRDGEVVGVTAGTVSTGAGPRTSLAIPSDLAVRVAHALMAGDPVTHPILGVLVDEVGDGAGAMVREALADGPGGQAGLRAEDVVTGAGGRDVREPADLVAVVQSRQPGDELIVVGERAGTPFEVTVTLGTAPPDNS